jgi:hypothetical protein
MLITVIGALFVWMWIVLSISAARNLDEGSTGHGGEHEQSPGQGSELRDKFSLLVRMYRCQRLTGHGFPRIT